MNTYEAHNTTLFVSCLKLQHTVYVLENKKNPKTRVLTNEAQRMMKRHWLKSDLSKRTAVQLIHNLVSLRNEGNDYDH